MKSIRQICVFLCCTISIVLGGVVYAAGEIRLTEIPLEYAPKSGLYSSNLIYIFNSQNGSVSVLDITKNEIKKTIPVESAPVFAVLVGKSLYVHNSGTNTVSIVNIDTLEQTKTIAVSSGPVSSTLYGTKLYVSNSQNNTLSLIETSNNLNIRTIEGLGSKPTCSILSDKNFLYVCNSDSSGLSVVSTSTNKVSTGIVVGRNPVDLKLFGKELFVLSRLDNNLCVVNTDTNTRVRMGNNEEYLPVGNNPQMMVKTTTKLYVINKDSNSVSVINSSQKKVTKTIPVGKGPISAVLSSDMLYVTNIDDGTISVIDTTKDAVIKTYQAGVGVNAPLVAGKDIYMFNERNKTYSVISSTLASLTSFNTKESSGTYATGDTLTIQAIFNRKVGAGSTIKMELNNGAQITLDQVENMTLSGTYVIQSTQDIDDLTIKAVLSSQVSDFTGPLLGTLTIPVGKNLGDLKNIKIDTTAAVDTPPAQENPPVVIIDPVEPETQNVEEDGPGIDSVYPPPVPVETDQETTCQYRSCQTVATNSTEYRDNLVCEGFISEEQARSRQRTITRGEVLMMAVHMLGGAISDPSTYALTFSDIATNDVLVGYVQTGLDFGLLYPVSTIFDPEKYITRIEAYALLMKSVCMIPSEQTVSAFYELALQESLTKRSWASFMPFGIIPRSEVYRLAYMLAIWAEETGGCNGACRNNGE